MSKPILIVVHGMGSATKESFKKKVNNAFNNALNLYPGYEEKKITDYLQIEAIEYNSIFELWRKKLADDATSAFGELDLSFSYFKLVKEGLKFQSKIEDNKNLYTHWLDVIFYLTFIGEQVRISVADQALKIYNDALSRQNKPEISILAISLGTAVIHDTLSKLYTGKATDSPNFEEWNRRKIDTRRYRFQTLIQIANVCPLLKTITSISPYKSIVRPGKNGCCKKMFNIDHKLDPIPNLVPFEPDNNEGWLSNSEWARQIFVDIGEIKEITKVNVHDLDHYLANPRVHIELLNSLLPTKFHTRKKDRQAVFTKYLDGTLMKNVKTLRDALKSVKITDSKSIEEIIGAFKMASEIIKTYEELT